MLEALRKWWTFVSLLLMFILLGGLVFWPALVQVLGAAALFLSLGVSMVLTVQNHWQHRAGKPFVRDLAFDLVGLGLTIGAAMYAGHLAGGYVGLRAGLWGGVLAGLASGFLAAWGARFAWERLTRRV